MHHNLETEAQNKTDKSRHIWKNKNKPNENCNNIDNKHTPKTVSLNSFQLQLVLKSSPNSPA